MFQSTIKFFAGSLWEDIRPKLNRNLLDREAFVNIYQQKSLDNFDYTNQWLPMLFWLVPFPTDNSGALQTL